MLEGEGDNVSQSLKSSGCLTIVYTLRNNDFDPSHVLCGIGPNLREHL